MLVFTVKDSLHVLVSFMLFPPESYKYFLQAYQKLLANKNNLESLSKLCCQKYP
ncbi:hypothetical protein GCM10009865_20470 [Aeromicrobium ponti]